MCVDFWVCVCGYECESVVICVCGLCECSVTRAESWERVRIWLWYSVFLWTSLYLTNSKHTAWRHLMPLRSCVCECVFEFLMFYVCFSDSVYVFECGSVWRSVCDECTLYVGVCGPLLRAKPTLGPPSALTLTPPLPHSIHLQIRWLPTHTANISTYTHTNTHTHTLVCPESGPVCVC